MKTLKLITSYRALIMLDQMEKFSLKIQYMYQEKQFMEFQIGLNIQNLKKMITFQVMKKLVKLINSLHIKKKVLIYIYKYIFLKECY